MDLRQDTRRPPLDVAREVIGDTSVISASGDLDTASCPRLGVEINEILRTTPSQILIDLCGVQFLDSTGLAVLLNARRRAQRERITLKLVCDVPQTLRLLDLTRLRADFDVYRSREHALAA